jgi:hypothetical protein
MSKTQTQTQTHQQTQIDRRAIIAIARAVKEKRSFVVWYGDIYDALRDMIEDDDEFHEVENRLYEDIVDGKIKGVYRFWGTCDSSECDIVVISPIGLNEGQLKILEELAQLYSFKGYDGDEDEREELTQTLHNLIKKWASGCLKMSSPAEAVFTLAKNYGMEIEEEEDLDDWYVGKIYYRVEGLDVRVVKGIGYCNGCVDFDTNNNFIEKCKSWRFEDEDA